MKPKQKLDTRRPPSPRGDAAKAAKPTTASSTAAPPQAHGLDDAKHQALQRAAKEAEAIKEVSFAAYMATALHLDGQFGPTGYRLYLLQLLEAAGDPKDPIERMLIEQAALMHHRIGQLHADAARVKSAIAAKIYNGATARLLGEFRRTALAIREYRSPRRQEGKVQLAQVG